MLSKRKGKRKAVDLPVNSTSPCSEQFTPSDTDLEPGIEPQVSETQDSCQVYNTRSRLRQEKETNARLASDPQTSQHLLSKRLRRTLPQGQKSAEASTSKTSHEISTRHQKLHTSNNSKLSMQSFEVIDLTMEYVSILLL